MTCRRCSPRNRSARRCASWRSTAGTGCPWYPRTGTQLEGWVTSAGVLRALARQVTGTPAETAHAQAAADGEHDDAQAMLEHPPVPLPGYHVAEITITGDSPAGRAETGRRQLAAGEHPRLGAARPARSARRTASITLAAGDRVSLLVPAPQDSHPPPIDGREADSGSSSP